MYIFVITKLWILLITLCPCLFQNHEYGGYGDEPRRKRYVYV